MLKGIDISNWQGSDNFRVPDGIDFCIVKATEGNNFVDPYCDSYIQDCIKRKILWGFYHFNNTNNPEEEAKFFYNNCKGYIGKGIPILDYEVPNTNNVSWVEKFVTKFHDLSGIWPIVYMSQIAPIGIGTFAESWVPKKCGLWCANYWKDYYDWPTIEDCPINPWPWEFTAIWQFASDFNINGFAIDADVAFMDKNAWLKYAGAKTNDTNNKNTNSSDNNNDSDKRIITGRVTIELD